MSDQVKSTLDVINERIEEKKAQFEGVQKNLVTARQYIQQNEPIAYSLSGAIDELTALKSKLSTEETSRKIAENEKNIASNT